MKTKNMILLVLLVWCQLGVAAKSLLFEKGPETFRVIDSKSKPAKFRVLDDSVTKQSLAVALNSILKMSKSEVKPYVDLHLQKIVLTPQKENPDKIMVTVLISGRKFDVGTTLSKADLRKGKIIQIQVPSEKDEVGLFTITSKGNLKFRFSSEQNALLIENAFAHFRIENPMTSEETEQIHFSGKGIRQ